MAQEITSVLSVVLGVGSNMVVGAMHDRASVYTAAMQIVSVMYPNAVDIECVSQTLGHCG